MKISMQLDPRYQRVTDLIKHGEFGWDDFFEPMVSSITQGSDYYLLANDFPSYIEAQASFTQKALLVLDGFPHKTIYLAELLQSQEVLRFSISQIRERLMRIIFMTSYYTLTVIDCISGSYI